MDELGEFTNIS